MRPPLYPALCALLCCGLLAAATAKEPASKSKAPKAPKELRDKVCKDGVYVRPKPAAAGGEEKAKTAKPAPKLPKGRGGEFKPTGEGDISKFVPDPEGDCSTFDKLFVEGSHGSLADSLEIAPAAPDGKVPPPERFTSLSGLTLLAKGDAQLLAHFFDGSMSAADQSQLAGLPAEAPAPDLGLDEDGVLAEVGQKPLPEGMTAAKALGLDKSKVPALNSTHAAVGEYEPLPTHYDSSAPALPAPPEPGVFRRFGSNVKAVAQDAWRGGDMISSEGIWPSSDLTDPLVTPPVNANPDPAINVPLPGSAASPQPAPGIKAVCAPGCYGTRMMIDLLKSIGAQYADYYGKDQRLSMGGVSRKGGGPFPPHVSHKKGVDADITFVKHNGFDALANAMVVAAVVRVLPNFHHINGKEYFLVDQSKHAAVGAGLDALQKQGILTAEQAARGKSVLVHWPNHNDHFHIRIMPR
ncbi:MAG: penicillin-insensitive murein endopeptidase [Elusimicrobia bacterium]|nr:penicillin-insensitive murein endopeptidase [Elusimicrobiota bacterium]